MDNTCVITIKSDGRVKEECNGVTAYYHSKYIFSKLKRRIENEREDKKIKIGEPVKVELEVISLGEVE
jgi:hypothetical protein